MHRAVVPSSVSRNSRSGRRQRSQSPVICSSPARPASPRPLRSWPGPSPPAHATPGFCPARLRHESRIGRCRPPSSAHPPPHAGDGPRPTWDILITSASSWLGRRDDRVSPRRSSPGNRCFRVLRGSFFKWPRGPFSCCRYHPRPPVFEPRRWPRRRAPGAPELDQAIDEDSPPPARGAPAAERTLPDPRRLPPGPRP